MKSIKLNFVLLCILASLFVGCGGKTASSSDDVDRANAQNVVRFDNAAEKVVGYWVSKNSANPEYEFFGSALEYGGPSEKHGRIFESGKIVNLFYWQLLDSGTILLNLVDSSCAERPLRNCASSGTIKIQATGSSIFDATWHARYEDYYKVNTRNVEGKYIRKGIDLSMFSQGEFALSKHEVFDTPLAGEVNGNKLSLLVNWFRADVSQNQKLIAVLDMISKGDIEFNSGEQSAFDEKAVFFVDGIGDKEFQVKTWYENVALSASQGSSYSLRYELHRKIQFPGDIDPALVHIGFFDLLVKVTEPCTILNSFVRGPNIKSTDKFFSLVNAYLGNDVRTFGGWAGQLEFSSNDDAILSLVDNVKGENTNSASRSYKWNQNDEGTVFLKSLDAKVTTIRFIKAIAGGYNVLYHYPDGTYSRHDLVLDGPSVVDEGTFSGRYKFLSNNAITQQEIIFHKDKTVTSNPNIVNGHWFQDVNGDIVSFECTTLARQDIANYAECYSDFDHLSSMAFVHIRRLGFVNRDGNQFQLRYAASFYGDVFNTTSISDDYLSLAWTYRWLRVSDE